MSGEVLGGCVTERMCHSLDVLNISVLGLESYTVVIRQNDKRTLSNNLAYFQQKCKSFLFFFIHNNQGVRRRNGRYSLMRVKKHFKRRIRRY